MAASTAAIDGVGDGEEIGPVLHLTARPMSVRAWFREFWRFRQIVLRLARADFQARYKRASLGILWAVGLPLVQAAVVAIVFSKLVRIPGGSGFAAYVLAGITAWSYFSAAFNSGATAIVDGNAMTDKVWFSRAVLPTSPVLSNLPGLLVTTAFVLVLMVPLGGHYSLATLCLIPGIVLLIAFAWSLGMLVAALHVYYRDVRFIVQAVMILWFYVTPLAYPVTALGPLAKFLPYNPATGFISLFHIAVLGHDPHWQTSIIVTVSVVVVMMVVVVEVYRRRDRVMADLL